MKKFVNLSLVPIVGVLVFLAFFAPFTLDAQIAPLTGETATKLGIKGEGTLVDYILQILNVFLGLVSIIAVAFLIIGGFQYITSAGNSNQAESAKKTIMYAIIGLIIIGLSWAIINFVVGIFAGGGGGGGGGK